jgi:flagellar biosynthetic protein FliQ
MAREAITTILIVSAPVLGIGLAVGLLVSIFQATTQIQEPTLAFVPKIAAVFIALLIFGGWILRLITTFTLDLWENLGKLF